ncbi:MAG: UPF0301 protein [Planctomycetota bacterium]|nr:MAG: UPF0301 protein [Planctomycetota bacterium]
MLPVETPSASGFLIVASPALRDPHFVHSVVLMIEHEVEGSFGLLLNRPVGGTLGSVVDGLEGAVAAIPLHEGGPVQTERVQLLGPEAGPRAVLPGLDLGGSLPHLKQLGERASAVRAYAGYAGWTGGQLHDEIAEGAWIVAPARAAHVLDVPPERLWRQVLLELGGHYAWIALQDGGSEQN